MSARSIRNLWCGLAVAVVVLFSSTLLRAEMAERAPERSWSFSGPFSTLDRASAQRGFQVYSEVCATCHSMHLLSYRDLQQLGFTKTDVQQFAAQVQVPGQPDDQGEIKERNGLPSDRFKSPYPNANAARAALGAVPPDLSVIVKARFQGADYIYAILTGYTTPPAGMQISQGLSYNKYFPGHQIRMPPPLSDGLVQYADGTQSSISQMAHDVVTFMAWASEPAAEDRKRTGIKTMLFLIALAGVLYALKRAVWANVH